MLKFVFSRRKVDAIFKRETAMACADPHQVIAIKLSLVHLKSGILAYIISFLFLFQVTWLLLDNIHEQIRERNSPRRDDCPYASQLAYFVFPSCWSTSLLQLFYGHHLQVHVYSSCRRCTSHCWRLVRFKNVTTLTRNKAPCNSRTMLTWKASDTALPAFV